MVNLPRDARVPLRRVVMYRSVRNHNLYLNGGPVRLVELEEFAGIAARHMRTLSEHPDVHQTAMNQLRQLFNLEFKMRCDVCGTAHHQDEITAPER